MSSEWVSVLFLLVACEVHFIYHLCNDTRCSHVKVYVAMRFMTWPTPNSV